MGRLKQLLFPNVGTKKACIVEHLNQIFVSREGMTPCQPDFGLPDLSDRLVLDFGDNLRQRMQLAIQKLEPRLNQVTVIKEKGGQYDRVRFHIHAHMNTGEEMHISGEYMPQGVVHVSSE